MDIRQKIADLDEEVRDHGIGSLGVNYTEAEFHEIMDVAFNAVELLAEALGEYIDGAGFWDTKVRKRMGWPAYPAKIPKSADILG